MRPAGREDATYACGRSVQRMDEAGTFSNSSLGCAASRAILRAGCAACKRKGLEQRPRHRIFRGPVFRVPLYADDKPSARQADRLDLAVWRDRLDEQPGGGLVDALA